MSVPLIVAETPHRCYHRAFGSIRSHIMDGYLGLPVSIWGNLILPFLGIHDALSLKLLNRYSSQAFPRFLGNYLSFATQCKNTTLNLPLYIQAKAEERVKALAAAYAAELC